MQTETFEMIKIVADTGKVFMRKKDNEIMHGLLYLGKEDSPDNYIEIDAPVIEEKEGE